MIKRDEVSDPQSCLNKAFEHEMLFVLLARDPAFVETVRFWISKRIELGLNKMEDPKIQSAMLIIEKVDALKPIPKQS